MTRTGFVFLAAVLAITTFAQAGPLDIILNFDDDAAGNPIQPGQVIDDEYLGVGVLVITMNHNRFFHYGIAFDSQNPTGGDEDLRTGLGTIHAPMGNVLVISENDGGSGFDPVNDVITDPDDEGGKAAGYFDFFFDRTNEGGYVTLLDIEADEVGTIDLYDGSTLVNTYSMLGLGDSSLQTVNFADIFDRIRVNMGGSGAVAEVGAFAVVPEPATLGILGLFGALVLVRSRRWHERAE